MPFTFSVSRSPTLAPTATLSAQPDMPLIASFIYFDDLLDKVEGASAVGWTAELIDYTGDSAAQMLAILRRCGVLD